MFLLNNVLFPLKLSSDICRSVECPGHYSQKHPAWLPEIGAWSQQCSQSGHCLPGRIHQDTGNALHTNVQGADWRDLQVKPRMLFGLCINYCASLKPWHLAFAPQPACMHCKDFELATCAEAVPFNSAISRRPHAAGRYESRMSQEVLMRAMHADAEV